jgi:hypothetical protein
MAHMVMRHLILVTYEHTTMYIPSRDLRCKVVVRGMRDTLVNRPRDYIGVVATLYEYLKIFNLNSPNFIEATS